MSKEPLGTRFGKRLLAVAAAMGLAPGSKQFSQLAQMRDTGRWSGAWWRGQVQKNYVRWPVSRYTPHQGAQECIRRAIGGFAAPRSNPTFTKRRLLAEIERGHVVTYTDALEIKYGR